MKTYYRLMLGKNSSFAPQCFDEGFIGADFDIDHDLSGKLPDHWREFNKEYIPVLLSACPEKSRVSAGLACGSLWVVCRGMLSGDVVLCPDGSGRYRVGEITGDYFYVPGEVLQHRRPVRWLDAVVDRQDMSDKLRASTSSWLTVCNISRSGHGDEVERLLQGITSPVAASSLADVEDLGAFAMEAHLEEFLIKNWAQTELGRDYDIFTEDGQIVGQQYPTDTGPIDILALSKDKRRLLVVELKKGRASDAVVGQTLRYMGYVQEELADAGQSVTGMIIALEDDQRIRRALMVSPNIHFYRYQISFKLVKS